MTDDATNDLPSLNLGTICGRCDKPFKIRTLGVHELALADRVGLTPKELPPLGAGLRSAATALPVLHHGGGELTPAAGGRTVTAPRGRRRALSCSPSSGYWLKWTTGPVIRGASVEALRAPTLRLASPRRCARCPRASPRR